MLGPKTENEIGSGSGNTQAGRDVIIQDKSIHHHYAGPDDHKHRLELDQASATRTALTTITKLLAQSENFDDGYSAIEDIRAELESLRQELRLSRSSSANLAASYGKAKATIQAARQALGEEIGHPVGTIND